MKSAVIEGVVVGSIKQRSLASSSCLECSQSYGDCVCEETSFQIAVAWLHKWSESDGEALQWAAHKMAFIWGVCSCGGRRVSRRGRGWRVFGRGPPVISDVWQRPDLSGSVPHGASLLPTRVLNSQVLLCKTRDGILLRPLCPGAGFPWTAGPPVLVFLF